MQNLPFREDGTVDLMELGRRQLEQMVNQIMDWQADELRGEGNRRNGYRERRLLTPVGRDHAADPEAAGGVLLPRRAHKALLARRPGDGRDREGGLRAGAVHPQDREGRGRAGLRLDKPLARLPHDRRAGRGGRGAFREAFRGGVLPVPVARRDLPELPRRGARPVQGPRHGDRLRGGTARGASSASTSSTPSPPPRGRPFCSTCADGGSGA